MANKLIVIDLDESLLREDKTYPREQFAQIEQQLFAEDSVLCVATGNSYHKVQDYFTPEMKQNIYFACDNGSYMVKNEELILANTIAPDTVRRIVDFLDEFGDYHIVIGAGDESYFREASGPAYEYIRRFNNKLNIVEDFTESSFQGVVKIAVHSTDSLDRNKVLARILSLRFDDVIAVTSGALWIDVYAYSGGKGSAVSYLQQKYQIGYRDTMVFGDSLNDESMMTKAKYAVVLANADSDLMLSANYQIGTNNEDAVVYVLQQYLQSGNLDFMDEYLIHKPR